MLIFERIRSHTIGDFLREVPAPLAELVAATDPPKDRPLPFFIVVPYERKEELHALLTLLGCKRRATPPFVDTSMHRHYVVARSCTIDVYGLYKLLGEIS